MKALVYTGRMRMACQQVADPVPPPGHALVAVEAVGICGSDMHAWRGHDPRRPPPLILGHEAAGRVRGGALDGRRVTVNPLVTNPLSPASTEGRENLCPDRQIISMPPREGAFAELLAIPVENLVEVPDHVDMPRAALAEPLAVCWHAARLGQGRLHGNPGTARCLVQGGGAIGLGSALSLRALGAGDIAVAEPNPLRHAALQREGLDVLSPESATGPYDLIIDAAGYGTTRRAACAAVAPGGVLVHVGLGDAAGGLDIRRMTLQEITFIGTYCYTREDFHAAAAGIFDGRFGDLAWMEHRALADGGQAFRDIHHGTVAAPKIILHP
ncbi:MAG: alcohol dehydrogenase catalytic domain-containing protein [Rhodobacteraceae bacterium]|nr:alcohol dehydrogenase catalytic domain-containing protein [Paracoccaceae bacterium]